MGIRNTKKKMLNYYHDLQETTKDDKDKVFLCLIEEHVAEFDNVNSNEIAHHLISNGMFQPEEDIKKSIDHFRQIKMWALLDKEYKKLREEWQGPNVPIYIYPSSDKNKLLTEYFHGKSGLAYKDKIFLFMGITVDEKDACALLIHEYNHVCRLNRFNIEESDLTLLDSIILEGLAEKEVEERLGTERCAFWSKIYNRKEAEHYWNKFIKKNVRVKKTSRFHHHLMYGARGIPKWLGYNIGYHIVESCCENHDYSTSELMDLSSKKILEKSSFN